jgi:hypothetical protein
MRKLVSVAFLALLASPLAAQRGAPPVPIEGGGVFPPGWQGRVDNPAREDIKQAAFMAMGGGFHLKTGRAHVTLWNPQYAGTGNYRVTATFTQLKPPATNESYGVIFGGANLDQDAQAYTYFLILHNGTFTIKGRSGTQTPTIVEWTPAAAIAKPDASGKSQNTVVVEVGAEKVRFLVNNQAVHSADRSSIPAVEGVAGLRFSHGLELMVDAFKVERM